MVVVNGFHVFREDKWSDDLSHPVLLSPSRGEQKRKRHAFALSFLSPTRGEDRREVLRTRHQFLSTVR